MGEEGRSFATGQVGGRIGLVERGRPGYASLEFPKRLRLPAGLTPEAVAEALVRHFQKHYYGLGIELGPCAIAGPPDPEELGQRLRRVLLALDRRTTLDSTEPPLRRGEDRG